MGRIETLQSELKALIHFFDGHSTRHKNLYRRLRYLVLVLAAVSTILAGLALAYPSVQRQLNVAIVVATAAVGVLSGVEILRKPGDLWILERGKLCALKDLKRQIEYEASGKISDDLLDGHFATLQLIMGTSVAEWAQTVKPRPANTQEDQ